MTKKTIIIFGASGGMGSCIQKEFEDNGYHLALCSRNQEYINTDNVLADKVDIMVESQVTEFVSNVISKFQRIDVCVNTVGSPSASLIRDYRKIDWDYDFALYVKGLIHIINSVVPTMKEQKSGYIINIGGLRAFEPSQNKSIYCSLKAASSMLMKVLQKEVEEYKIKVTTIHPGFTDTLFHKSEAKRPYEVCGDELKKIDIVKPEDIAKLIYTLTLLSDGAYVKEIKIGKAFNFNRKEMRLIPCMQIKK